MHCALLLVTQASALELSKHLILKGLRSDKYVITASSEVETPFDGAVILVTGPKESAIIWKKERMHGVWGNKQSYFIPFYNSLLHIYSTHPLLDITSEYNLKLLNLAYFITPVNNDLALAFQHFQEEDGLFHEGKGMKTTGGKIMQEIIIPKQASVGSYSVYLYLFLNKSLIHAQKADFNVINDSFFYKLNYLAHDKPFIYACFSTLLALFLGGNAAFLIRKR